METVWQWLSKTLATDSKVLLKFNLVRQNLIAALRRIRDYRRDIASDLALPLYQGNVTVNNLHALIVAYTLVPLHDESQLQHTLLDSPITSVATNTCILL
jgi:hypothetical protein